MKPYGSRRNDVDLGHRTVTRGGKSSRTRAKREGSEALDDICWNEVAREIEAEECKHLDPCDCFREGPYGSSERHGGEPAGGNG
jgi:hypothetical protein